MNRGRPAARLPLLVTLLLAAVTVLTAAPAREALGLQPSRPRPVEDDDSRKRPRIMTLSAGWGGYVLPGQPGPWRVTLRPGEKPVDATLAMSFQQDGTQRTRIEQRVALIPGQPVMLTFTAALLNHNSEVNFTLQASNGATIDSATASVWNSGPGELRYETPTIRYDGAVLFVGRRTMPPAANGMLRPSEEANARGSVTRRVLFASVPPQDLPADAAAFGGVEAIVLDQQALMDLEPTQQGVLREFLFMGGRVVLLADTAGEGWKRVISGQAAGDAAMPIVLGDSTQKPIAAAVQALGIDSKVAAASAFVRGVQLTGRGTDEGWELLPAAVPQGEALTPLLARGPVGLGYLTVYLMPPSLMVDKLEGDLLEQAWNASLLASGVGPSRRAPEERNFWSSHAQDSPRVRDMQAGLAANMPPVQASHALAWVFGLLMLGLGLMLGIGDMVIHKRDKKPRAYITAAVWIAVACGLTLVLPVLFLRQTGFTMMYRQAEHLAPAEPTGAALEYQTAAHALLSAEPGGWMPPMQAAFGHGVDLSEYAGSDGNGLTLPTYRMLQTSGVEGRSLKMLSPLRTRRSSLHCFMETGRASPSLIATAATDTAGNPVLRIGGLPPGAVVSQAALLPTGDLVADSPLADSSGTVTLKLVMPGDVVPAAAESNPAAATMSQAGAKAGGTTTRPARPETRPTAPIRAEAAEPAIGTLPYGDGLAMARLARARTGRFVVVSMVVTLKKPEEGAQAASVMASRYTVSVPTGSWPRPVCEELAQRAAKAIAASIQAQKTQGTDDDQ